MSYYDNRDAKVTLAMALEANGWKIFGFREDASDMMTDYYCPAYWSSGLATKNGYVFVCDNHSNVTSGYEDKKYNYNKQAYKASDRITKLEAMMQDPASTENEKASCAVLIEKEKEKQGIAPTYTVIETYPTYSHGNPKGSNWHVEKDGQILAKGNGAFAVNNYDWEDKTKTEAEQKAEKLAKFIAKIEKVLTDSDALKAEVVRVPKQVIKPVQKENTTIEINDILSFSYHGHFWIVTRVYTVGEQVRVTYELLGSEKRGYQRTSNAKGYYQPLARLEKEMNEGKVKVYTLQEVTEYVEKTVFKKTSRKQKVSDSIQLETSEEIATDATAENETNTNSSEQNAVNATMTINKEKNGIEIKFSAKPSSNVIEALKENGFRWSSYSSVWWVKQSPERLKFAQMIVDTYNSVMEEESAQEATEAAEEAVNVEEETEVAVTEQQEQDTKIEVENPYSFDLDITFKYHDVHFKAWNYSVSDLTDLLNLTSINYYESGEKLICTGLTLEQVAQIEMINKDNGAIIFYDDKYNELSNNSNNSSTVEVQEEEINEDTEQVEAIIINGKIKVKSIKFEWSESNMIDDKLTVNTFKEAEEKIRLAASKVDGGYDKTKFIITWTDGETYTGRIDVEKEQETAQTPIKDHITDWLLFLTGDKKPAHMTDMQYQAHTVKDEEEKKSYYDFLKSYALTDIEPNNSDNVIYHDFYNSSDKTEQEEQPNEEPTKMFEDILSKFDDIEVTAENRISAEDLEFCTSEEQNYRIAIDTMISFANSVKDIAGLDILKGEWHREKSSNPYLEGYKLREFKSIAVDVKNKFISSICNWFSNKYNVTIDSNKMKFEYNVTYNDILDAIMIQLDGFSFTEKAEKEIRENLKTNFDNRYSKVNIKNNKIIFTDYVWWDNYSWSGTRIGYSEGKVKPLFNALSLFEDNSTEMIYDLQTVYAELKEGTSKFDIFSKYEFRHLKKVKSFKVFKNGKTEIEFSNYEQAKKFLKEYCGIANVA